MRLGDSGARKKIVVMKKTIVVLVFLLLVTASYLFYKEFSFVPLEKRQFKQLFIGDSFNFRKHCNEDFLGAGIHGELFEFYNYSIEGAIIDKNYPQIVDWENKQVTSTTIVGKWKRCPIDSLAIALYESALTVSNFDRAACSSSFKNNLRNSNNYYSYVFFSESEKYFMLYSPSERELHYVRMKGL